MLEFAFAFSEPPRAQVRRLAPTTKVRASYPSSDAFKTLATQQPYTQLRCWGQARRQRLPSLHVAKAAPRVASALRRNAAWARGRRWWRSRRRTRVPCSSGGFPHDKVPHLRTFKRRNRLSKACAPPLCAVSRATLAREGWLWSCVVGGVPRRTFAGVGN